MTGNLRVTRRLSPNPKCFFLIYMLLAQNTGDTRALNSKTKVGDNKSKVWCKVWTKAKKKKKKKRKGEPSKCRNWVANQEKRQKRMKRNGSAFWRNHSFSHPSSQFSYDKFIHLLILNVINSEGCAFWTHSAQFPIQTLILAHSGFKLPNLFFFSYLQRNVTGNSASTFFMRWRK